MKRLPFILLLVTAGVLLDQLSKFLVFNQIAMGDTRAILPGFLNFTPALNKGVAFSMLNETPNAVIAISIIAVPAIAWWVWHGLMRATRLMLVAQSLLLIGAIGNMIDRIWPPHSVRDFLDLTFQIPLIGRWAIFNVADICICAGVGLFIAAELVRPSLKSIDSPSTDIAPSP